MSTTPIKIEAAASANEFGHIEKALEAVPRVSSVEVGPAAGTATVEHDGADVGEMKAAVRGVGFIARLD
ncbi:MAG TPA: heavy-metal-associated domain-containing protein [Opitutus sp.]|nr:heavy-metal-associated domain-containing protein [Opitutus sp.]